VVSAELLYLVELKTLLHSPLDWDHHYHGFIVCHSLVIFTIPYFQKFKFVRVSSLVGRYFYNVYIYIVVFNCVLLQCPEQLYMVMFT